MAYTQERASKRAYNRMKHVFSSRLYCGQVGLFGIIRYWFKVRRIVRRTAARRI
jgi:hypothetical protein